MRVLIIEDNSLKRDKIVQFLHSRYSVEVTEAASYNSGLSAIGLKAFDFMILDMSMPTFDKTEATQGGRFRSIAGRDIAYKLNKSNSLIPFVVLTGYKDFDHNSQNLSIDQIDDLLKTLGDKYKGYIIFDSAEVLWQEQLSQIIDHMKNA